MPLQKQEDLGTNRDGSVNGEYGRYCNGDGAFTVDCTMKRIIEHCARFVEEFSNGAGTNYTREEAIAQMRSYFPSLKAGLPDKGDAVPARRIIWAGS